MSNELEFSLHNVEARELIETADIELVHEVNPRDVVELNVSLAGDIVELNSRVAEDVEKLVLASDTLGGIVYGGSSVLSDVSFVEPHRYRTTSLSESCAHGFLDITSQQIVLGVTEEGLGFELYNFFRNINPALLALTASSPYIYRNGKLDDTGRKSRRMVQYSQLCSYLPEIMWREMPTLYSLDEYLIYLQCVSDIVNQRLKGDYLDANWSELQKVRRDGEKEYSYVPFTRLEPHQIYWFNRIRPDHRTIEKGGDSLFSLELRVPDIPTSVSRIQMLNSFVAGLSYYIADHGYHSLPIPFNGEFNELRVAARYGLDAQIAGVFMRQSIGTLGLYATKGLEGRGYPTERFGSTLEEVLTTGNDADTIRSLGPTSVTELRNYLGHMLRGSV